MIKKAVVAAAGKGVRMRCLTNNKSKHLINLRNKPFLFYVLKNLLKAGYSDIVLVAGYRSDLIKDFLKKYDFKVRLVNQFDILGEQEYGTVCPIKCAQDMIGKEDFIAIYGDNLYSVADLKALNINDNYNYVAGQKVKRPEKYGVLVHKNGFLEKIVEKPKKYLGDFVNTGLYKFTPEVFDKIPQIKLSPRGEYELTDAVSLLAQEGKVKVKQIQDYCLDLGNPGDIIKLSNFLKTHGNFKD